MFYFNHLLPAVWAEHLPTPDCANSKQAISQPSCATSRKLAATSAKVLPPVRCTVPWIVQGGTESSLFEYHFQPDLCQSRVDGKNGSQACTVIALCAAAAFLKGDFIVAVPDRRPDDRRFKQLVECMQFGNNLYDERYSHGGPLLGVY